jgi:hypothetical protein
VRLGYYAAFTLLLGSALALWHCNTTGATCRTNDDCKGSVCGFNVSDGCHGPGHCMSAGECGGGGFPSTGCGCDGLGVEAWCSGQGFGRRVMECPLDPGAADGARDACSDSVAVPPSGAMCIVRGPSASLPGLADPNVGPGYARIAVSPSCVDATRLACTDDVFQALMREYCTQNPAAADWEVVDSFDVRGCAVGGCQSHACPDAGLDGGFTD